MYQPRRVMLKPALNTARLVDNAATATHNQRTFCLCMQASKGRADSGAVQCRWQAQTQPAYTGNGSTKAEQGQNADRANSATRSRKGFWTHKLTRMDGATRPGDWQSLLPWDITIQSSVSYGAEVDCHQPNMVDRSHGSPCF